MRVAHKSAPYVHMAKLEVEQHANKEELAENTLEEVEEPVSSQMTLETPRMIEKDLKIPR